MRKSKEIVVTENLETIENWAKMGMSEKQIANNLKISYSTFRAYKKTNSALCDVLCRGTEIADEAVENALYKRALGYDVVEEKGIKVKNDYYDDNGRKCTSEKVVMIKELKHIPADVNAQKFWLTNRKKLEWKDNPHKVAIDKELINLKVKQDKRIEKAFEE